MATRGRKPTPTALKVIEGNPGKRSLPKNEPVPVGMLPKMPAHLAGSAADEWHRIANGLHLIGILTEIDAEALAAYCDAYGQWIDAKAKIAKMAEKDKGSGGMLIRTSNGNLIQNPLIGIANKARSDMIRFAAEFGLTPSARARLSIDPAKSPSGKFGDLIGGKGKA